MANSDKLIVPVDVDLNALKKAIGEIRKEFLQGLGKQTVHAQQEDFPPVSVKSNIAKIIEAQGKHFEIALAGDFDEKKFTIKDVTEKVRKKQEDLIKQEEAAERNVSRQIAANKRKLDAQNRKIAKEKSRDDELDRQDTLDDQAEERIQLIADRARKKISINAVKRADKIIKKGEEENKAEEDLINKISANVRKRASRSNKNLQEKMKNEDLDLKAEEQLQRITTRSRAKQKKAFDTQKLQELKTKITGLPEEEQVKAIDEYIATGGAFVNQVNAIRRNLNNKIQSQSKNLKKQKFTDWTKQLQTIDPLQAINQLDAYIANRQNQFIADAKILRQRIQRTMQNNQRAAAMQRNRNFANNVLIGAGAGIGLLGQAGFPLLNIGFAAMSGAHLGAGIAAATTAIGETVRALNSIRESSIAAARELGAVSSGLKSVEARMKAFDAFSAQGALTAQQLGMEDRLKIFRDNPRAFLDTNTLMQNAIEAFKTRLPATLSGSDKGIMKFLPQDVRFLADIIDRQKRTREELPNTLQSSLRNMQMQMQRPTVGIETDPYQTWLRIQNSAFDPLKQEEVKYQREMIKMYKEMIKALNANTSAFSAGGLLKRAAIAPFGGLLF